MPKKYRVTLTEEERADLSALIRKGKAAARTLTHARLLLKADQSPEGEAWKEEQIVAALDVGLSTVMRVRQIFVEEGVAAALKARRGQQTGCRKLDGEQEAHLIALACGAPPVGHARWTLRLLANRMVRLEYVDTVSYETVRQTLKKMNSNRGESKSGACRPPRAGSSWPRWKTCWKSTLAPPIRADR